MKILASIPVKEIKNTNTTTYISEIREVECIWITRNHVSLQNKNLNRFHYQALVIPHEDFCGNKFFLNKDGLLAVNIIRSLNKKWKPPVFEKDSYSVKL